METAYPLIGKSYKGRFPFRIGTTSYIYPAPIFPNVTRLSPFLDEIELVLFESSGEDNLPGENEVRRLREFSEEMKIRFNVHLPIDIFLGDRSDMIRSEGIHIIRKFIGRTIPLRPSVYTLHYSLKDRQNREASDLKQWKEGLIQSSKEILKCGIEPSRISIETLGYPFEWIEEIVKNLDFSVCLDIGHLFLQGLDVEDYLERYLPHTSIIHLHGIQDGRDHLGIDRLDKESLDLVFSYLRSYQGILSIEVFNFDELKNSLEALENRWQRG